MYDVKRIQNKLLGLVGYKQTRNIPAFGSLPETLTESRSGLYVDSVHSLLNKENIHASISFAEWPDLETNTESVMAQYLKEVMNETISEVLSRVFTDKKIAYHTKSIFEDVQMFSGQGNRQHRIIKENRFCGLLFTPKQFRDIDFKIHRVAIQVTEANPDFNLYLFHTSQAAPLQVFTFNIDRPGMFQWFETPGLLLRNTEEFRNGGSFLLGYFEEDVIGQVIEARRDLQAGPCMSCNQYDIKAFERYSKFIDIHPFSLPSTAFTIDQISLQPLNDVTVWDDASARFHYTTNFGLNLSFTSMCNVSDFVVQNEIILADAIAKGAGLKLLRGIAFSTENKGLSEKIRQLARYEIDTKENNSPGLAALYEKSLEALSFDLSGMDSACLPTVRQARVTHGTI